MDNAAEATSADTELQGKDLSVAAARLSAMQPNEYIKSLVKSRI